MGKYMRKSKGTGGGVALMEVSHTQASLGVRTRAKVALERLQKSAAPTEAAPEGGRSYLQLRSRRLEKISPIGVEGRRQRNIQKDSNSLGRGHGKTSEKQQQQQGGRVSSRLKMKGAEVKKEEKEKVSGDGEKLTEEVNLLGNENEENKQGNQSAAADTGAEEACIGENVLEFEGRERTTRESTPCSLIRDPDIIRTPGSSTRPSVTTESNNRENSMRRHVPTANEMNEFFARVEEQQQKQFMEKYNYDPVNDKPLPGRYVWEKLKP